MKADGFDPINGGGGKKTGGNGKFINGEPGDSIWIGDGASWAIIPSNECGSEMKITQL